MKSIEWMTKQNEKWEAARRKELGFDEKEAERWWQDLGPHKRHLVMIDTKQSDTDIEEIFEQMAKEDARENND